MTDFKKTPTINGVRVALVGHTHTEAPDHNHNAFYAALNHAHALADLSDVEPASVQGGDLLAYDTGTSTWLNRSIDYLDLLTQTAADLRYAAIGHAHKLDDLATPDDNTDLNVSTSVHGLAPKTVAPSPPVLNYLGVANGETSPAWKSASSNPGAAAAVLQTDTSGYVQVARLGIGVTPSTLLHLSNATTSTLRLDGGNTTYQIDGYSIGNNIITRIQTDRHLNNTQGMLTFHTAQSGTLYERMRIDSAGNTGVGVTPTARLHAKSGGNTDAGYAFKLENSDGNVFFFARNDGYLGFGPTTTNAPACRVLVDTSGYNRGLQVYTTGTLASVGETNGDALFIFHHSDDRMAIQVSDGDSHGRYLLLQPLSSAGRVGIAAVTSPAYSLDVGGAINTSAEYRVSGNQVVTARQAAVANATNATDVITQLNALLARLRTHGLIAT
jgi:hypothetical protein